MNDISLKRRLKVVGTRPVRPDGVDKVMGRAQFGGDAVMPGMIFGSTVRSPHAHARIIKIDTSAAEAMKGVRAVVTGSRSPQHHLRGSLRRRRPDELP